MKYTYKYTPNNKAYPEAKRIIDATNNYVKASYQALRNIGQTHEDAVGILPKNAVDIIEEK